MSYRIVANRLATFATLLADAVHADAEDLSASAAAALVTLRRNGPTAILDIARTIGLTHSATVRLIDRLEKDWLVRRLSRKGREVKVELTARGRRRAGQFQDKRIAAAETLMAVLDSDEIEVLARAVDKMLEVPIDGRETADHVCRACDGDGCRAENCPVDAAAERFEATKGGGAG
ncbi:MAG: MarR family transcriptional regulator [Siculibacillus sp.]|nr:MarR family transcriptional regulator [Siculibacillus sp.]